jgi:hypothetical protein
MVQKYCGYYRRKRSVTLGRNSSGGAALAAPRGMRERVNLERLLRLEKMPLACGGFQLQHAAIVGVQEISTVRNHVSMCGAH